MSTKLSFHLYPKGRSATEPTLMPSVLDSDGNSVLFTSVKRKTTEATVVNLGDSPNSNNGDPLRTAFAKINNFIEASYWVNDSINEKFRDIDSDTIVLKANDSDIFIKIANYDSDIIVLFDHDSDLSDRISKNENDIAVLIARVDSDFIKSILDDSELKSQIVSLIDSDVANLSIRVTDNDSDILYLQTLIDGGIF